MKDPPFASRNVALITGGGKGIGRAIALQLAARGVRVMITGRDEKALGDTVGEIACGGGKARHLVGDVRDRNHVAAAITRAVEVFDGIDIVIANANANANANARASHGNDDEVIQTNLMGVYYTFRAAIPKMKGAGRLIAISRNGDDGGDGVASAVSRAGIEALVRATACEREVASQKITCNAIVLGSPEEDAAVALALFLCSSAADDITGQAIAIGAPTKSPTA